MQNYIKGSINFFQCLYCSRKNRECYCTDVFTDEERDKYHAKRFQEKFMKWMIEFAKAGALKDVVLKFF